jgi:hypothetical protein
MAARLVRIAARRRVAVVFAGAIVAVALAAVLYAASRPEPDPELAAFNVGVTHTRISADEWQPTEAVEGARDVLRDTVTVQNQHLMGFGALNPQPAPGDYDWTSLDARVELMRDTGALGVMTLCCAPDWMKGGDVGETDWDRLEVAPDPAHYADFAALAAEAAARYPDIEYFLVWNELKGFYLDGEDRWDYEGYTELYNLVYEAVKEARPDAKIGGPYVVMDSWEPGDTPSHPSGISGIWGELDQRPLDAIAYWLDNALGADFIVVDGRSSGYGDTSEVDPFVALEKFAAVNGWLQERTELPLWWAEYYASHPSVTDPDIERQVLVAGLELLRANGVQVVLLWDPNGTDLDRCGSCLWSDVRRADGGEAQPLAAEVRRLNE